MRLKYNPDTHLEEKLPEKEKEKFLSGVFSAFNKKIKLCVNSVIFSSILFGGLSFLLPQKAEARDSSYSVPIVNSMYDYGFINYTGSKNQATLGDFGIAFVYKDKPIVAGTTTYLLKNNIDKVKKYNGEYNNYFEDKEIIGTPAVYALPIFKKDFENQKLKIEKSDINSAFEYRKLVVYGLQTLFLSTHTLQTINPKDNNKIDTHEKSVSQDYMTLYPELKELLEKYQEYIKKNGNNPQEMEKFNQLN